MTTTGEWVPGGAPLDEGYWEALLRDEEHAGETPAANPAGAHSPGDEAASPGESSGEAVSEVGLDELSPGDIRQGRVTNLCSFGAFVDLGGVEGLIHISELSWGRIDRAEDVLNSGQFVDVYVLNVDRERGRVGLSLKRLLPDPWQFIEERYQVGQVVEGVITHVVDFGAFARVEEGLEGLIHVSELADGSSSHPRSVVREGDIVKARVISVDGERRRMGLSLKQTQEIVAAE